MVSLDSIYEGRLTALEYVTIAPLDIFDSPDCRALATQAIASRHLRVNRDLLPSAQTTPAIPIILIEDQYPGWLQINDLHFLTVAQHPYQAVELTRAEIVERLPQIIAYTQTAMATPNQYLWGGTTGPDLDCSGLMQRAYGSQGIWIPRDAYQQEGFVQSLSIDLGAGLELDAQLEPGDLVFFGTPQKATHVGLYLGAGEYIHSSGKEQGRNCIGIDSLVDLQHPVSQTYAQQFRGAGRVMSSYCPEKNLHL